MTFHSEQVKKAQERWLLEMPPQEMTPNEWEEYNANFIATILTEYGQAIRSMADHDVVGSGCYKDPDCMACDLGYLLDTLGIPKNNQNN